MSALLFLSLGLVELHAWWYRLPGSMLADLALDQPWVVALPMSLNNLASGLAGGLSGIHPMVLCAAAFAASWTLMAVEGCGRVHCHFRSIQEP